MIFPRILLFCALILPAVLAEDKDPLIIKHADSFEYFNRDGLKLQKLTGRVEIHYRNAIIKADTAIHSPAQDKIEFFKNVRLDADSQVLQADRLTFFKKDSSASAKGHVVMIDPKTNGRISGGEGQYSRDTQKSRIWNNPVLLKLDSAGKDTLKIVSKVMEHYGKEKKAIAIDNVVLTQGRIRSYCGRAEYYQPGQMALLIDKPLVYYDSSEIKGDTIRLFFNKDTLKKIRVVGNAYGRFLEENKRRPDSSQVSRITGDTLEAYFANREIQRMEVRNHSNGINFLRCDTTTPNTLSGKGMDFFFTKNALDSVHVFSNAKSTYYYTEENGEKGKNEMTGDTLNILFTSDRVSYILAKGSIRGTFYER
jgi:lipopolysaccharide export system protein LptA